MKTTRITSAKNSHRWLAPVILAVVLIVLFAKSFLPDYVHFSNDGPLGQQNAHWLKLPSSVFGMWDDLNDVGFASGSFTPNVTAFIKLVLGPVGYAKFYAPVALFILAFGAWIFLRTLKLSSLAALMGALATMLSTCFFAGACWGVASVEIAIGFNFLALALVNSNNVGTLAHIRWTRLALAGLCVGINVMEAADVGALCSMFITLFVIYKVLFIEKVVSLEGTERIIVLCCVNGGFLSLFILGIVFGLGILKLCLLLVILLVATIALNWSLTRKLIPLTKIERIVVLSSLNSGFLLLFVFGIIYGFGFFALALLLIVASILNWALLCFHLFVNRCGLGVIHLAVIAIFAAFLAAQTITALVGTFVQGISGTAQDTETKAEHWDWATQWSLPKTETLGVFVPGLFGYRMDTPKDMMPALQDDYRGGVYWGGMGRSPEIDRFFDGGGQGNPPGGMMRFGYGGYYCGILVALVAFWTIAQSLRRQNSPFSNEQKKFIWFWTVVLIVSLLLAWGRFAPMFYGLLYQIPYFSTIRNPAKFLIFFMWALAVLFAYGINVLSRLHLEGKPVAKGKTATKQWGAFDRNWIFTSVGIWGSSVLGWLAFAANKPAFIHYLQKVGYGDEDFARQIAAFSIGQAGWFLVLFAIAIALLTLVFTGYFSGSRAKFGTVLLGVFLVFDLGRADLPFVIHWDYKQKYEVGSLNPIEKILCDQPYEHRVAKLLPAPLSTPSQFELFDQLYGIEWTQHHFPYYNIQSLDVIQMSRVPEDLKSYMSALRIGIKQDATGRYGFDETTFPRLARLWELSNTHYLLGPAAFLDVFNAQFDPGQHRFRVVERFSIGLKPGVPQFHQRLEELTAYPNNEGEYALFDFTGALPRAKLYSNWLVNTNDQAVLNILADQNFDPAQTVLIDAPQKDLPVAATNENSGTVEFKSYAPKHIVLSAQATSPSVLLLNDKYDPHWNVSVDGKPAELLRCNFLMRGVRVPPGTHMVEFQFSQPNKPLYITLSAIIIAFCFCGLLFFPGKKTAAAP